MTDAPVVGSAAFELRATKKKLGDDIREAERDLKGFGDRVERDLGNNTSRLGTNIDGMARKVAIGITAVVAALSVGIMMAVRFGQASLKMADDIGSAAKRIGVTTDALQELRYVAAQTGEDAKAVDAALEGFGQKLAQAGAGLSREAMDAFAALGFTQEQIRSFKDTEEGLTAVMDRIGDLSNASDRAAIAEKLGLGPLATALRLGSDEVDRLRDEAAALGLVMDASLVAKGMEAQVQLENLAQVIGVQMAEAFVQLSDEVLAFTGYIADALKGLNNFIGKAKEYAQRVDDTYGSGTVAAALRGDQMTAGSNVTRAVISGRAGRVTEAYNNPVYDADDPALLRQQMAVAAAEANTRSRSRERSGRQSLTPVDRSRTRANTSTRDTERAAEREARRAERVEQEIFRARQRYLGLLDNEFQTAQQRFDAQRQQLSEEREARKAELDSRQARKDITAAERAILDAKEAEANALQDRLLEDRAWREIQDEQIANERLLSDLTADLVSLQSGSARTAGERLKLERELLEITQRQRREALRIELERNTSMSAADKQAAMNRLGQIEQAETAAVNRRNQGPLEAWRDRSLQSAQEVREAYESIAARGLDSLNDGLVDAIMNTEDLGQTFSRVAKQIIADLAAIAVRRSIVEPLANMLFGGAAGGGGGGGFLSGIGRFLGLSSASPALPSGDTGGLFSGRLLGNLASPLAGIVGSSAQAAPAVRLMVQSSPFFTAEVQGISGPIAVEAAAQGFNASRQAIPAEMGRRANYRLR